MSPRPKNGHDTSAHWGGLRRLAIVGAASLKGRELKDVLEERKFPAMDVKLLDDDESLGQIDAVGEEATFIQAASRENFADVEFAFFASEPSFTRKHWKSALDAGATVIDLSYALEKEAQVAVRSPWMESELASAGVLSASSNAKVQVIAHPAATVLALLLSRAQKLGGLRNSVVTVFEPASEQGRRGMDELHQQTVSLLSFQQMPHSVFDSQVAFNVLSRYGAEAGNTLESVEQRILGHFEEITRAAGTQAPKLPSLMLLQGPTFHAHTFSLFVETESPVAIGDFAQALSGEHVNVTRLPEDAPTNVSAAGQNEIQLSLRRDLQRDNAFWVWAAVDNLKVAAISAVQCAETSTPQQAIQ